MFGWLTSKISKSQTYRAILRTMLPTAVWSAINYEGFAKEGYQANVYVYACVRQIARAMGGIPWIVYQKKKNGDLEEVEDHPLMALFRRPNPQQGWSSFVESWISNVNLFGNAYIEAVGPKKGVPRELYSLRPDRMKVKPGDKMGIVGGYVYSVGENKVRYEPGQILHLKTYNPLDDWYGMAPLLAGARSVDQNNEGRAWNVALLQNKATPPGALSTEQNLSDIQFERMREQFQEQYAGARNAGKALLLEGGISWQSMGLSPTDMDWLQGMKMSSREICTTFGTPPELIGDHENATYSNYQEARKAFYQETVLPFMDWARDEFNNWLSPRYGEGVYVDYDTEDVEALAEDRDAVWTRARESVKAGILTPNEARQMLGYEDLEGGDMLFMPGTMVPSNSLGLGEDEE